MMPQNDRYRQMDGGRFVEFNLRISISLPAYPFPTLIFYLFSERNMVSTSSSCCRKYHFCTYISEDGLITTTTGLTNCSRNRRRPCVLSIISNPFLPHSLEFALLKKKRKTILQQTIEARKKTCYCHHLSIFSAVLSCWFKLLKDELSPTKVKYSDAYFAVKSSLSLEAKDSTLLSGVSYAGDRKYNRATQKFIRSASSWLCNIPSL